MKKKSSLSARYQKSYEDRDKGGNQSSAFDWKKIDHEVKFYKPKEGKNFINIVPYTIKTAAHPLVRSKDMAIGDQDYVMDVWMHKSLGPGNVDALCPKKTYGKACPVCDASSKAYNDGDKETGSNLRASRRVLYNVVDVADPDSGVQVFDTSHYLFEKELIEAAREESANGEIIDFADPDDGCTITFRGAKTSIGTREYLEFKAFAFVSPRKVSVVDEDLEGAVSFDEVLKTHTADELSKIMYGGDDEDEEAEAPARGSRASEAPARTSRRAAPEPEEEEDEEEEEEAPPPARASRRAPANDPDPTPAPSRKSAPKKAAAQECPSDHEFGKDNDEFPECNTCTLWDACARAQGA